METDFKKNVGKRIQEIRKLKGISQELLAERVGVETNTVSYWERGKNAITFGKLPLIASALGVPVYKLFTCFDFENDSQALMKLLDSATQEEIHVLEKVISTILLLK